MPISADIHYQLFEGSEDKLIPPLVLIHGAGGNLLYWHPTLRRLPNHRVYTLDLPGHGKSNGRGQQTIQAYAHIILSWMESIELFRAAFVGHSMGSAIALTLALEHPHNTSGLVLIGSGTRLPVNKELIEATASETTYHKAVDSIVKWSFSPDAPDQLTDLARKQMIKTRSSVLHGDFLACNAFDVTDKISEIQKPTLVICGEKDKMTPLRYSQFIADNIPHAKLAIIPQAGHMVTLEQPELVADAMLEFLPSIVY
jgi:pimeloyl-ACP methyl ester carboxylesterase